MDPDLATLPPLYSQHGLHVEMYDPATGDGADDADAAFMIDQARAVGGPVLELACGTGRVAWPVAAAGFEVIGLDISRPMLDVAEAQRAHHAPDVQRRVRFVEGDMAAFELDERFGLIYITFRSFQALLSVDDQRACLGNAHRHLRPGGRLVIDLFDPRLELLLPGTHPHVGQPRTRTHPRTDHEVTTEITCHENNPVKQVLDEIWQFTERDDAGRVLRQEHERLTLRWIYRYEMRHLLELCGLEVIAEYSDFTGSPPAYGREQVWVARRP